MGHSTKSYSENLRLRVVEAYGKGYGVRDVAEPV
jgi:transposase